MMMSKIKFDVNMMTLTVSKKFWNNASVPFSPEYETIKRIRQDYPSCRIEVKKTAAYRNPNRNLSYNMMETYIQMQSNSAEMLDEFYRIQMLSRCHKSPYHFVLQWFTEKFPMALGSTPSCHEEIALAA